MSTRRRFLAAIAAIGVYVNSVFLRSTSAARKAQSGTDGLDVYLFRGGEVGIAHRVHLPQDISIFDAAMIELARAPFPSERAAGLSTTIRSGTSLRTAVTLDEETGVANANFSIDFLQDLGERDANPALVFARAAQVVFTLTQFDPITGVTITVEGDPISPLGEDGTPIEGPLDRTHFELLSPAILVESPAPWMMTGNPLVVTGTANTFEASLSYRLTDGADRVLSEGFGSATSGTGTRGTFEIEIAYEYAEGGRGTLMMFENSAADGSEVNIVAIPVELPVA